MVVPCLRGCCSSPFVRKLAECLLHLDVLHARSAMLRAVGKSKNNFTHMTSSYSAYMFLASIALQSVVLIFFVARGRIRAVLRTRAKTRYNPLQAGGRNENGYKEMKSRNTSPLCSSSSSSSSSEYPQQQPPPPTRCQHISSMISTHKHKTQNTNKI